MQMDDISKIKQDEDLVYIYDHLVQDYGAVTFEAFINLLVCIRHSFVACFKD